MLDNEKAQKLRTLDEIKREYMKRLKHKKEMEEMKSNYAWRYYLEQKDEAEELEIHKHIEESYIVEPLAVYRELMSQIEKRTSSNLMLREINSN